MKPEELLKSLTREIDEAASLMKSYTDKLKKNDGDEDEDDQIKEPGQENQGVEPGEDEGQESQPEGDEMTPAQEEVVDAAQGGEQVGDITQYAQSLSQEELEGILQVLMDEYEGRGGAPQQPEESPEQIPEGESPAVEQPGMEPGMDQGMGEQPPSDGMPQDMGEPAGEPMPEDMGQEAPAGEPPAPDMQDMDAEQPTENQPTMSLDEAISQLSPEEKAKLKAALEAALGGGAPAPAAAPATPPMQKSVSFKAPATKKAGGTKVEGSVKGEPSNLMKSFNNLCDSLEKIIPGGMPASAYADANITVLEKSDSSEHNFKNGFELANRLLVEQKKGNKLVKSMHVAEANTTDSSRIGDYLAKLKDMGINL